MKDLPTRTEPRLNGYDYSRAGCYFVTICVQDRHEMLGRIVGGDAHIAPFVQLSEYGNITKKYIENIDMVYPDVSIPKYVVMPDHVHLIVAVSHGAMWASPPTKTNAVIPKIIRSLKTIVTKQIGFSFWQRSYHDHIIRDEDEYRRIWQYINENPAKWDGDEYYVP